MTAPDEEFLTAWSRDRQAAAFRRDRQHDDRCTGCGHGWHGLRCRAMGAALPCPCETSFFEARS